MNRTPISNEYIASKRLNRVRARISDIPLNFDLVWCRTAYNETETWTKKNHKHSFYEFHYCLRGNCMFLMNLNEKVRISQGQFFVIPPRYQHQFFDVGKDYAEFVMGFTAEYHHMHADGEYFKSVFDHLSAGYLYQSTDIMRGCVDKMLSDAYEGKPALTTAVASYAQIMMLEAARQISPRQRDFSMKQSLTHDLRIEHIRKFINDNPSQKLTCEDISRQLNLSVKQLNRIVRKETALTLSKLISQIKVEQIKQLLETTDCSLSEIAERVGYSNEYNLGRFFKKEEGMSPGRYRDSLKR